MPQNPQPKQIKSTQLQSSFDFLAPADTESQPLPNTESKLKTDSKLKPGRKPKPLGIHGGHALRGRSDRKRPLGLPENMPENMPESLRESLPKRSNQTRLSQVTKTKTRPRRARPKSKQALHLVLRSELAKGRYSLLTKARWIEHVIHQQAQRHGVRVYRLANAGNHLHLVVLVGDRMGYARWIRAVTGQIARGIVGASRREPQLQGIRFWSGQLFSRVVSWGRAFHGLVNYLKLNALETATGLKRQAARALLQKLDTYLSPRLC